MKRILLAATAGAAVLALGGTAVALTIADSPTSTAGLGSVQRDDPTAPTDDPAAPTDDPTAPTDGPTAPTDGPTGPGAVPTDEPTPGRTPDDRATAPTRRPAATTGVSADAAIRIALARTGDSRVVEVELEEEHGRIVWKVETSSGNGVTRVDVDASTGAVTRVRAESGDDDRDSDDRDGDDDGGHGRGSDDPPGDDRGGDRDDD